MWIRRRVTSALSLLVLLLGIAAIDVATAPAASAAGGCTTASVHYGYQTYNCYMYRSSVRLWMQSESASRSVYQLDDNVDGILYQGTSWFVCQRRFVSVQAWYGSAANDWWAYTLGDRWGYWGWVSAVHLSGGANWGPIPGLATCASGFGDSRDWPHVQLPCGNITTPGPDFSKLNIGGREAHTYIGC